MAPTIRRTRLAGKADTALVVWSGGDCGKGRGGGSGELGGGKGVVRVALRGPLVGTLQLIAILNFSGCPFNTGDLFPEFLDPRVTPRIIGSA